MNGLPLVQVQRGLEARSPLPATCSFFVAGAANLCEGSLAAMRWACRVCQEVGARQIVFWPSAGGVDGAVVITPATLSLVTC